MRSDPNAIYVATNFDKLNFTGAEVSLKYYGFAVSYTALHGAFNARIAGSRVEVHGLLPFARSRGLVGRHR